MNILTAVTCIFRIVNVEILNTRERVPRRWGWPRVSSEKFSRAIIRVFCNIYLDTHNTIESIEGVGAT